MSFLACSRNPMGIDRDPLLLVFLSEPMKLREPPGEVEGRRGNNASEEPPAKKWFNDNTLEVRYNSYLVVAEAKLVLDQQEGISVSKDDRTYGLLTIQSSENTGWIGLTPTSSRIDMGVDAALKGLTAKRRD